MIRLLKPATISCRYFSITPRVFKKKPEVASSTVELKTDTSKLKESLESVLTKFTEKVKHAKSTGLNTDKFQNLEVEVAKNDYTPLKSLATIAARGNKIIIVAFDPNQVKRIQTALISQLNVPGEPSPNDKQTLSVTIPSQGADKKAATAKLIKDAYENLRNSGSKDSIASIRAKYLNPLKKSSGKNGVSKTDLSKQTQDIEQLVKVYNGKLQDLFKKEQ